MIFRRLSGGKGCSLMSATPGPDLHAYGYREDEYAVHGNVRGHTAGGEVDAVDFVTRILVRRPTDADRFNGTLVVEWLNVSSGNDAAPEYTYLADELVRAGYAYAGVSAQFTGIEGGSGSVGLGNPAAAGLAGKDPERYGMLRHPGDAYCHNIFASIGESLRSAAQDADHPLTGLRVQRALAVGESQSAMALTTYTNEFARAHGIYDGYLIHSRSASALPLGEVGAGVDINGAFTGDPVTIRDDLDTPVLIVQTETDVLTNFRYHLARQPDTNRLRVWEIAGTSHADLHQIGPYEDMLGCPTPVNRGQQRFVLRAGLRHLNSWAAGATVPPAAPPLHLDHGDRTAEPVFVRDAFGNVLGGVRTPCVDAATQKLSGVVEQPVSRICLLFGSTETVAPDLLAARYGTREGYDKHYRDAADAAIAAGFMLADDRDAILADANPDLIP
ncbi:alpha/beta hydrolase domain-containing protein [Gordonia sp. ABSL1-1]|uniref:alpha/beta hydrolase domain-containing protein n=1 Tax=Gordonia sp. ABSL1-1 TaxID=3053923 RepID=UPI002572B7C1|nr:alpha/beta hydrolase domain-containing protein [Gordonia sp. ABSL1-1]MDL9937847.1 alpha/beta hydrolase domain-containing protein [Gordonia sp. ABSL1-1]